MRRLFAGLDVSQNKTAISIVDPSGIEVLSAEVATTSATISAELKPFKKQLAKVAHETGPLSQWLHGELMRRGFPAMCLDARQVRAALAGQRNKSDRNDARDIAKAVARGLDCVAFVKSDESFQLRMLLTYRRALKRKASDLDRCLQTTLKSVGVFQQSGRGEKGRRKTTLSLLSESLEATMVRAREGLRTEAAALDQLVTKTAKADPVCRRLMTVPGVGPITALTFRAAVDDPARFTSSRMIGAHFGLTPRRFQSGSKDIMGRISRFGDREVRAVLFDAARVMLVHSRKQTALREWGLKLRKSKGYKVACVACARKMAVILHRIWVTENDFQGFPGSGKSLIARPR